MSPATTTQLNVDDEGGRRESSVGARIARSAAIGLVPPLVAFTAEATVFAALGSRWLIMVVAVIVSAAYGGMVTGLIALVSSAALVWWFLIPPVQTLGASDARYYLSVVLFLAVGFAISLLHERLRRTNQRLARAARQNQLFTALIENSVDFVGIADTDGKPVYLNPAGRRMVELPEDVEIERTGILDYYAPDQQTFAQDVIVAEVSAHGTWAGETRFRNWRTGGSVPVLDTHFLIRDPKTQRVIGMGTITRDISEQKAQRDELETTTRELRAAQHVARVGSWRWNARTDQVEWSEEMYRIFGLDPACPRRTGMLHEPDSKVLKDESKVRGRVAVEKTLADGRPYEVELEFTRPDGSTGWVVSRGEPMRDDAGHITGITGTSADITKLKELQRLRDEWTSVIAHDLRQPISTILMASEILPEERDTQRTENVVALVERIHAAAQALRRMVDDLLDMSLLESNRLRLERRSASPRELVRDTLERLAHLRGIERVHVDADAELPPVFVDSMRIVQVLTNLVSNAIKYGDERSDVSIALKRHGTEVEIAVTNRGRGIAPDELPRLFNRFARSRTARGSGVSGLGLGLYIARGVMQAHGGRLWAESTPGETTTFVAALPTSAEQREAA